MGTHIGINTRDTLTFSGRRFIATIGVRDMIMVDTDDVVRDLVYQLKREDLQA